MIKIQNNKVYDLEERTARFGESIILFCRSLSQDTIIRPIIIQLIRSATSIGANYMEANGAESKKDFLHKVNICKKESKETMHWLRMLSCAIPSKSDECKKYWQEAKELTLIFSKICLNK